MWRDWVAPIYTPHRPIWLVKSYYNFIGWILLTDWLELETYDWLTTENILILLPKTSHMLYFFNIIAIYVCCILTSLILIIQKSNPPPGGHEINNFRIPFFGHHLSTLGLSNLSSAVETMINIPHHLHALQMLHTKG